MNRSAKPAQRNGKTRSRLARGKHTFENTQKNNVPTQRQPAIAAPNVRLPDLQSIWRNLKIIWQNIAPRLTEISGLGLGLIGILLLLALLEIAQGGWLQPITFWLRRWLGWGAAFVPLTCMLLAAALFARRWLRQFEIPWNRLLALELLLIQALALSQFWSAYQKAQTVGLNASQVLDSAVALTEASQGAAGGLVGWSLAWLISRLFFGLTGVVLAFGMLTAALTVADLTWLHFLDALIYLQARLSNQAPPALEPLKRSPVRRRSIQAQTPTPLAHAPEKPTEKAEVAPKPAKPLKASKPSPVSNAGRDPRLPDLNLLAADTIFKADEKSLRLTANQIAATLEDFAIPAQVKEWKAGPTVTQFLVEPGYVERTAADGSPKQNKIRVSQIASLANDLALSLAAGRVRIEAPVPGTSYIGIEVPNGRQSKVGLRSSLTSEAFRKLNTPLTIALGLDVAGQPRAADLSKMPHLLVAGTTGSGKSVCISSIITALICNNTPETLRLVMVDPKKVELVRFNGLPHLLGPVEVQLERIIGILKWAVREMERRYRLFEKIQARDLKTYNQKIIEQKSEQKPLPYIVIIIDELADLMMQAANETEQKLARLAQMARATGMHLVVATQRPSTDVITGLIKANFPARIAFAVTSVTDSRVILDTPGAEALLGKGDMLFQPPDAAHPLRVQGVFVSDDEIERVVEFWRTHWQHDPESDAAILQDTPAQSASSNLAGITVKSNLNAGAASPAAAPWEDLLARQAVVQDKDEQILQAIEVVQKYQSASASLLQRKLNIGYPRAARLMDELREMGLVGSERTGGKTREVFVPEDSDPIGERANAARAQD